MAASLPEEVVQECDIMQLVDGDETFCCNFIDACGAPVASSHVEQLLVNCSVGVSITTDATVLSESCATSACASGGARCSTATATTSPEVGTTIQDDCADFLLDGELFLRDMEKVITSDLGSCENQKNQTALEQSECLFDMNAFADLELLASPSPSAPSTCTDESPCKTDTDEFELESLKAEDAVQLPEPSIGNTLPPMSPPRPPHMNTIVSESSYVNKNDDNVTMSGISSSGESNEEVDDMEDEDMTDEMNLLEKEATYLDAQLDFLQSRAKSSQLRRQSIKQRRSRGTESNLLAKSQKDKQLLNELVMQQKVYQDNLKAMLALAPVNEVRMALMTPMESYIRLSKDFDERRKKLLSLREEKLDMSYRFIEQKAAGLDYNKPYQYSDIFEKFGKYYCVNFSIARYDGVSVFQVGRALYEQVAGIDEALNNAMGSTTIRESFDTIKCNLMHQRIVSSMKWDDDGAERMPDMESNSIFYCRFGDNSAVLSTDYIDQDDLHPYDASNRIRKDISSGVVLSSHTDSNGMKFVVMKRYLMAKYHMYPHNVSEKQQKRFFANMPRHYDAMKSLNLNRLQQDEEVCYPDKSC
ncbi:uncharacterized protein PHALS_10964 [Plasmopara halstedii]|uniref:Uncharacterized protein n=1 Tax=Plasmopara halstedii TaxID=4781 RepID=A0A0P1AJ55_PLAHL|nr:uncharacterized protein PHALS_10964 [Plasmopara halstedii]CEG40781.1 hypothetical protein PHALS_10964 [Plasmopara halstedii]|eukprot:XP_024577150.1 hypothetical protein PHALS_10964 [Plasmopara halstedii]